MESVFPPPFPNTTNSSPHDQAQHFPSSFDFFDDDPLILNPSPFNIASPPPFLQAAPQLPVPFPQPAPPPFSPFPNQPYYPGPADHFWAAVPDPLGYSGQQRSSSDAWVTKVARSNRKMARQKSINLSRSSSSSSMALSGSNSPRERIPAWNYGMNEDHKYTIYLKNNKKKMKLVFKKELKNSDVSHLGRIVIPKRDAEDNLPFLTEKEGIQIVVRDLNSDRKWTLKYKFWLNNKSRMYVLEGAGDFLKENQLEMGDTMIIYEDELHHYYFSSEKADKRVQITAEDNILKNQYHGAYQMHYPGEEEDAALALLIENLRHRQEQEEEANSLLTLSMGPNTSSSYEGRATCTRENPTGFSSCNRNSDQELPGVNHQTYPFLQKRMSSNNGAEK